MKLTTLSVLSAALLAGSMTMAAAQSTPPSGSPAAANQGKCYDQATKQVRDKTAMGGQTANRGSTETKKPGDTMTGASPTGQASGKSPTTGSGSTGPAGSTAANTRPPEAAGLPNC